MSVKAQLKAFTPHIQDSQYQKIKSLKDYTSVLSFLERNDIDDIENFYSKIEDMNRSFYVLKGEKTKTEKTIYSIDKKLELWEEYKKLKPILEKYNTLSDTKKKIAHEKNFEKIDRALELQKIWKDYKESGNSITPKAWEKESAELKNNVKLYNWKMDQFKDELGRAEKITKKLDEMQIANDRTKPKSKDVEI